MPSSTYFVQECPSCGRHLQVRLEYLGKSVACRHCERVFQACLQPSPCDSGEYLLDRAEELLASIDAGKPRPR